MDKRFIYAGIATLTIALFVFMHRSDTTVSAGIAGVTGVWSFIFGHFTGSGK